MLPQCYSSFPPLWGLLTFRATLEGVQAIQMTANGIEFLQGSRQFLKPRGRHVSSCGFQTSLILIWSETCLELLHTGLHPTVYVHYCLWQQLSVESVSIFVTLTQVI